MVTLEELVVFCKIRGFVYSSSSIYGGLKGFFDFGPLGVELKNNLKKFWWKEIVLMRDDVFGMDCSNVINKDALFFSGHQNGFQDTFIDCKDCKCRFRDDELKDNICPKCGSSNFSEPRSFKLMMNVNVGPVEGEFACLRPETAQSMFINFKNIMDSFSPKLPFGIAQIGKAYRNEVTPKNFIFRSREFEQMEMEFFVEPQDSERFFFEWKETRMNSWKKIGLEGIFRDQAPDELAHYSKATSDIMFKFPHGYDEVEGIANRGDFDLGSHTKAQSSFDIKAKVIANNKSTEKLCYNKDGANIIPNIIEVSAGLDRAFLAVLYNSYYKDEKRTVLKLPHCLSPIKAAVCSLVKNNDEMVNFAKNIFCSLKNKDILPVVFEFGSNIGKIYKKHDEIGTPFCITVDHDSLLGDKKDTVTVRYRDTTEQVRIHIADIVNFLKENL
ncbi:glycine--tRNA ligase [Alphaproteobacteria bacterium endosymbiont of Tiliacea citrago]|uniref:glycine--tRNA ligase n=1 Tax=Alphaproteobacteria bacterium endosymbiont of Tiliacea citrago TaxID=3077944 RepID=UPI00313E6387